MAITCLLYILTSVWVVRTPNAGQNSNYQHFLCKKAKKSKKFAAKFCKKQVFLSLHQNAGWLFYSLKMGFFLKNTFLPMKSCKSLLLWIIFGFLGVKPFVFECNTLYFNPPIQFTKKFIQIDHTNALDQSLSLSYKTNDKWQHMTKIKLFIGKNMFLEKKANFFGNTTVNQHSGFSFLTPKILKLLFQPAFGVRSTQTLVEICNTCLATPPHITN